ncbi:thyrotroph embryonic factor-like [Euwallacea fornicatus]|uniref:thyrotroph embryonic factor-like n=1 Tax=Euwallacea fornicatus TaxID=995702 RepID=UPI00338E1379
MKHWCIISHVRRKESQNDGLRGKNRVQRRRKKLMTSVFWDALLKKMSFVPFRPFSRIPVLEEPIDLSVRNRTPESDMETIYPSSASTASGSSISPARTLQSSMSPVSNSSHIPTRPFKSITHKGSTLPVDPTTLFYDGLDDDELAKKHLQNLQRRYEEFRLKWIEQVKSISNSGTNENMRRTQHHDNRTRDPEYLAKRAKNNESAKRSRDARKAKQEEVNIRIKFLEQEIPRITSKIKEETEEVERLRRLAESLVRRGLLPPF